MQHELSRTKIKERARKKSSSLSKEVIAEALKHKEWQELARILASSTRKYSSLNLWQIDKQTKEGDVVIIPGKILSSGVLSKKIKIAALSISETAKEKLKMTKSEFIYLVDEIRKNPKAQGVKILR